jgi:hypothetical protein
MHDVPSAEQKGGAKPSLSAACARQATGQKRPFSHSRTCGRASVGLGASPREHRCRRARPCIGRPVGDSSKLTASENAVESPRNPICFGERCRISRRRAKKRGRRTSERRQMERSSASFRSATSSSRLSVTAIAEWGYGGGRTCCHECRKSGQCHPTPECGEWDDPEYSLQSSANA